MSRGRVLNVNGHIFCYWCGNDTVEEDLDGGQIGGWSAQVAVIFDVVASHGEANAF